MNGTQYSRVPHKTNELTATTEKKSARIAHIVAIKCGGFIPKTINNHRKKERQDVMENIQKQMETMGQRTNQPHACE